MSNLKMAHLIFYQKKNIDWGMGKFLHSVTFEMLTSSKNLPYVQAKSELEKGFCYISAKSCQSKHALLIHERNHFPQIDVWKSPKLLKEAISHKPNDTVKTKKTGFDNNLSQSIVAILIQPSHFFLKMELWMLQRHQNHSSSQAQWHTKTDV